VTIGVRLHPSVCRLLLSGGAVWDYTHEDIGELDQLLLKHKVYMYSILYPIYDMY